MTDNIKVGTYSTVEILMKNKPVLFLSWLAYHSCIFGVSLRCTSVSLVSRPFYKHPIVVFLGVSFRCTPWGYRPTFYRFTWVQWSFFPGILLHAPPSRKFPLRVGPWGARYLTRFLWCLQTAVKYACNQVSFIKTLRHKGVMNEEYYWLYQTICILNMSTPCNWYRWYQANPACFAPRYFEGKVKTLTSHD